jgi:hypothetical protein
MSTRISSLAMPLLLAGCADSGASDAADETSRADAGRAVIACALDGAASFADECWYERVERGGEVLFVVHHPDGGFRRFDLKLGPGFNLSTADGAEAANVTFPKAQYPWVNVRVGDDRYRIPVKYVHE